MCQDAVLYMLSVFDLSYHRDTVDDMLVATNIVSFSQTMRSDT